MRRLDLMYSLEARESTRDFLSCCAVLHANRCKVSELTWNIHEHPSLSTKTRAQRSSQKSSTRTIKDPRGAERMDNTAQYKTVSQARAGLLQLVVLSRPFWLMADGSVVAGGGETCPKIFFICDGLSWM